MLRDRGPTLTATALALTIACAGRDGARPIRYDGATTIAQKVIRELMPAHRRRTGATFASFGRSGSTGGLRAVLAGEADVAGVARELGPDEKAQQPFYEMIGYDAIAVYVNDRNPVQALSREQIKAVFTGRITSWKQLGWEDAPIVAVTEPRSSGRGTLVAFQARALDGEPFGPATKELQDSPDCVAYVSGDPHAIAPGSTSLAVRGARPVAVDGIAPTPETVRSGAYVLGRPLLLVSRVPPTGAVKALFDLALSPEGQRVVARHFTPVR